MRTLRIMLATVFAICATVAMSGLANAGWEDNYTYLHEPHQDTYYVDWTGYVCPCFQEPVWHFVNNHAGEKVGQLWVQGGDFQWRPNGWMNPGFDPDKVNKKVQHYWVRGFMYLRTAKVDLPDTKLVLSEVKCMPKLCPIGCGPG